MILETSSAFLSVKLSLHLSFRALIPVACFFGSLGFSFWNPLWGLNVDEAPLLPHFRSSELSIVGSESIRTAPSKVALMFCDDTMSRMDLSRSSSVWTTVLAASFLWNETILVSIKIVFFFWGLL